MSSNNSSDFPNTGDQAKEVLNILKDDAERTYKNYETMLNEKFDGSVIDENKNGLGIELSKKYLDSFEITE